MGNIGPAAVLTASEKLGESKGRDSRKKRGRRGPVATLDKLPKELAPEQDKTDSGRETENRGGRSNSHDSSREGCQCCQLMPSRSMLSERSPERSLGRSPAAGGQSATRYTGLFALQVSMPLSYRGAVPDGGCRSLSLFGAVHRRRVPVERSATAIAGSTAGKGRQGQAWQQQAGTSLPKKCAEKAGRTRHGRVRPQQPRSREGGKVRPGQLLHCLTIHASNGRCDLHGNSIQCRSLSLSHNSLQLAASTLHHPRSDSRRPTLKSLIGFCNIHF